MNMRRVTTRRSALGLSFFGFFALLSGCDNGVPPSQIEAITDQAPAKAEADARKKAFGTTGAPKSEKTKHH
jgi:hypothetical protein